MNILPFLVGVDCVMFMVWDKTREIFKIAESYCGKWKSQMEKLGEYIQPLDYVPWIRWCKPANRFTFRWMIGSRIMVRDEEVQDRG